MKLKSGRTFWQDVNRPFEPSPALRRDVSCDVAIVGGGIVGALLAYHLTKEGLAVVLVDKRKIGTGSTSASTALLLYELDVHLTDLVEKIGKAKALRVYRLSLGAIGDLRNLMRELGISRGQKRKKSLYIAFEQKDLADLEAEYRLRKKHGFRVSYLQPAELETRFGIEGRGAILSQDAAEIDPFLLTQALFRGAAKRGLKVFGKTEVRRIRNEKAGSVLETDHRSIRAKHVVMATGYESQKYIRKKVVELKSSYVIVSKPVAGLEKHWLSKHLVWETARPYLYVRTTSDGRVMVGGSDEEIVDEKKRDALIPKKSKELLAKVRELIPDLDFELAYAWAGTFGETKDGMGYIGVPKPWRNTYFALGFGGNGISFGAIAADAIARLCTGKKSAVAKLFSFDR